MLSSRYLNSLTFVVGKLFEPIIDNIRDHPGCVFYEWFPAWMFYGTEHSLVSRCFTKKMYDAADRDKTYAVHLIEKKLDKVTHQRLIVPEME